MRNKGIKLRSPILLLLRSIWNDKGDDSRLSATTVVRAAAVARDAAGGRRQAQVRHTAKLIVFLSLRERDEEGAL